MKAVTLLLALAFGAMQGVSITDCPCGSYCETKNSCPSEKHQPADDCCSRSGKPIENCFHLEPQTDLVVDVQDDAPVPVVAFIVDDLPAIGEAVVGRVVAEEFGRSPPSRSSPLFLLHSCLLL